MLVFNTVGSVTIEMKDGKDFARYVDSKEKISLESTISMFALAAEGAGVAVYIVNPADGARYRLVMKDGGHIKSV